MKRFIAIAAAIVPVLAAAETTTWNIDPVHSETSFGVKHLVVSTVRGHFGKTSGVIKIDDADITKSSVQATIDTTTIDTREPKRDADLKSANFLDVEKHPTMTFASTKVDKVGSDSLKVAGNLTLHGTTKPVVLDVTYSQPVKGMQGETRRGFSGTTKINRKDFGLLYSKAVEAGPIVGDEVAIQLDVEAIKEASPR
jgi:polyisoprenoid-binding protein YceI